MPSTQKAFFLGGKIGNLVVKETEVYKPGTGEILVKVQAASLNPVDWRIYKFGQFIEEFPAIIGYDIAGDVEELGEGVTDFKKGDRIFFQNSFKGNHTSGFQQYTTADASTVAKVLLNNSCCRIVLKIPPNWTYDQASALPVAATRVYVGLYNQHPYGLGIAHPISKETQGILAGTPILIFGGATSVGQLVIQFAKLSGFSPIFATASLKHTEYLKSLGVTDVLDRNLSSSELLTQIKKVFGDKPINYIYDTVASPTTQQNGLDVLASGGKMISVLSPAVKVPEDKTFIYVVVLMTLLQNFELLKALYHDHISGLIERGFIKPNNIEVLPNGLAGIADGLARMQADKVSGSKLVAHPQET